MDSTAEWITALATCVAAVGTIGALFFAANAARSASTSARQAGRAIEAEARPVLIDVPYEPYMDHEHEYPWPPEGTRKTAMRGQITVDPANGTFAFPVRNVGRGAAHIEGFSFSLADADGAYREYGGRAIPAGEDYWLAAQPGPGALLSALQSVPSPVHGRLPYVFTVEYTDLSGKQRQRLELGVGTRQGDSALRVLRLKHVEMDQGD